MAGSIPSASCPHRLAPSCAHLLDARSTATLARASARVLPLWDDLWGRWTSLHPPPGLAGPAGQAFRRSIRDLLDALASGDPGAMVGAVAGSAASLRDAGAALQDVVHADALFADACVEELASRSDPVPDLLALRAALGRLGHVRGLILSCVYTSDPACLPRDRRPPAATVPETRRRPRLCGLVGASDAMQRLYAAIESAARGRETALIVGESGTGKELVAGAIHVLAGDPPERFIPVNCAGLSRDLMDAELFGHRRGAFSGAVADRAGLVRAAAGGTLFLDEITELPPEAQAKLLRVVQERMVRAVGEVREVPVQVRIVAATNHPLPAALSEGRLRRDLYYRLQRCVVVVPPLRDRLEDVPALAECFAERWRQAFGVGERRWFAPAALRRLQAHDWPGNVRELENVVFTACDAARGGEVREIDLPDLQRGREGAVEASPGPADLPVNLREAERRTIAEALRRCDGNKALAARVLGISRKQLYVKIRVYGLEGT